MRRARATSVEKVTLRCTSVDGSTQRVHLRNLTSRDPLWSCSFSRRSVVNVDFLDPGRGADGSSRLFASNRLVAASAFLDAYPSALLITRDPRTRVGGRANMPSAGRRLRLVLVDNFYGREAGSAVWFDGASAINATPIITRTATPISSPREIILRNACVPITAA